ncbi:MAG: EAL domain-containing protein [Kordiimonadaceae bacterium]|nr:EAL domain-containing protein [Kordiimonadaceae bacterium]
MIGQIYLNILEQHDYQLLLIALVLCSISAFSAVSFQQRTRNSKEFKRDSWILVSAGAVGFGSWATQFISILAFVIDVPVAYSFLLVVAALLWAIIAAAFSFRIAVYNRTKRARGGAGLVMGAGIAGTHFLLVGAIEVQGALSTALDFGALATVIGVGFAVTALVGMNKTQDTVRYCAAAGMLAASICSMHFISMAGLQIDIDPHMVMPINMVSQSSLVVGVSLITFLYLGVSLAFAFGQESIGIGSLETAHLKSLADAALEGIVVMDAGGHIVNANQSFLTLSGRQLVEIRSQHVKKYFHSLSGHQKISDLAENAAHMDEVYLSTDSSEVPTELFFRQARVDGETLHVMVVRDLREKQAAEQQITYLSNYDQLTGLANRQVMMAHLSTAVAEAVKQQNNVALFYIDIDGFKEINSLSGQQVGDELLVALASRLKTCVSNADLVARIGADQFCIIQEKLPEVEQAGILVEKLCTAIDDPFLLGDDEVPVSVSIGITSAPSDTETPGALIGYAELAMKHAKSTVGNSYHFYEEELDKALLMRRQLKTDLAGALTRNEISMVYQPQFGTRENDVVGFEALVRWQHPDRGFISPAEFIPLAEESGFIIELGRWVLEEACREAASWKKEINIAVNLSPVQFKQDGLPEVVAAALKNNNLDPKRLEIEITEGVLIDDVDRALKILTELKKSGTKLAMDDFGTG